MARKLTQAACKASFCLFLLAVWAFLGLPKPTRIQYRMALFIERGPRRRMLQGYRGVGKSWITGAYVVWCLLRDPNERIMVISASKSRADLFSTFCQRIIMGMPMLESLRPNRDSRWAVHAWDVGPASIAQAPSVRSIGITGQLTGGRATKIIFDDVEIPNNSATPDQRDKLMARVGEAEAIIVPGGEIVFLGTFQSGESIYIDLIKRMDGKSFDCRFFPVRYPDANANEERYYGRLDEQLIEDVRRDPSLVGQPTDPDRFSEKEVYERELFWGRSEFTRQFMLDTSGVDGLKYPLKTSDLVVLDIDGEMAPIKLQASKDRDRQLPIPCIGMAGDRWFGPLFVDRDWQPFSSTIMVVDPSGRGKDETTWVVLSEHFGYLYLRGAGGFQGGYDDATLMALVQVAKQYKANECVIEGNFGDGMFLKIITPWFQREYPCRLTEVSVTGQKERRIIDSLEPVMNQHRLIVARSCIEEDLKLLDERRESSVIYSLFYQMTHITEDRGSLRHDDRLDALAIGVRYWTDTMAKDTEKAASRHMDKLMDKEFKRFLKEGVHVGGSRSNHPRVLKKSTWI